MSEPEWIHRGKSIARLMKELATFDDPSLEVRLSTDDGRTTRPVSLVAKQDGACVLVWAGEETL